MTFIHKYSTTIAWILTWLVLGGTVAYVYTTSEQGRRSVCALRGDLKRRVGSAKQFLREHPHGAFGFTTAQIKKGYQDQERTIKALSGVSCSNEEETILEDEKNE